jgi:hypothetical protein
MMRQISYQENGDTLEAYKIEGQNLILVAIIWANNTETVNVTFEGKRPSRQFDSAKLAMRWIEENL